MSVYTLSKFMLNFVFKMMSSKAAIFLFNPLQCTKDTRNSWCFYDRQDSGFYISADKRKIFIGFENIHTGEIVGNYIKYNHKKTYGGVFRIVKVSIFFIKKFVVGLM